MMCRSVNLDGEQVDNPTQTSCHGAQGALTRLIQSYVSATRWFNMREHGEEENKELLMQRVKVLLQKVGLNPEVTKLYPHELSGGMKQRVCIAQAICLNPQLILADEPTSALDVVTAADYADVASLQLDLNATVLLVGHDMGLMAQFVDRVGIMYDGKLVEVGTVLIFAVEASYTQRLISSVPSFDWLATA